MSEAGVETAHVSKERMLNTPVDEDGEWGDEDEGVPLGSENNDGDEEEMEADAANPKPTTTSTTATSTTTSSSRSGSKSHHKSSSEKRRKHHHRHHHSGSSSSSRSERRSRRKSAAAASSSVGDARDGSDDRDRDDNRDALSSRLGGQTGEEDSTVDSSRRGSSSSRRRSDSFGDSKSGHLHHDNYNNNTNNQQAPSSKKAYNSYDHASSRKRIDSSDYGPEGGGGGSGDAFRSNRKKDSHSSSRKGKERGGAVSSATVGEDAADEAEDGEILEDGELDDDEDGDDGEERQGDNKRNERNEREGSLSKSSRGFNKYSPSDRKRGSTDYKERWKRDADDKKRSKKLYNNASGDEERDDDSRVRSSTSPPSGATGALPTWGSGVSQAVAPKASPTLGSAGAGYRNKPSGQGGRHGKSGGHGGQSPPGLYDSPSYSEDSDEGMMSDGYMDGDDKDYENMRVRRARKRGLGDSRKRGGPPRKKTLMEMAMSERPICKFFMDGKCAKGSGCQFNHDIESPRPKMEVCKYHLTVKGCHREHCLYMHENYPCKYYHTGAKCFSGDRCKFSHAPLTEETRRALALRVAEEDIVDMEAPEYREYRNYPSRGYDEDDDGRDYDQGDYHESQDYQDVRNRPSLLGSPPRNKKIPSLFEIKVTPPGPSPQAGSGAPGVRQAGFSSESNKSATGGAGVLNSAMGSSGGLIGNMNMNQQQQQQQQLGMRPGLLGPGGPLPARNPNAAMLMSMQQQQQMVRPGFGLAGAAPAFAMNNLQQQRALGNATNTNNGNLPPVLNMLGSLIQNLQGGAGPGPAGNMNMMAAAKGIGNLGNMNNMPQNNMNNMNNMGQNMNNMGQNNMNNIGQNNMNNMGQNMNNMGQNMNNMGQNMNNMGQNMNTMGQNMNTMGQNNMGTIGNIGQTMGNMGPSSMGQSNLGLLGTMPSNSMANMGANLANRNAMPNMGPGGQLNNGPGNNNNMTMAGPNNVGNVSSANAMNMGMGQIQANGGPMGPGLLRLPMQQAGMNNTTSGGLSSLGNMPVSSSSDMYNVKNAFNVSSNLGPVSNPGQEVGIMDVDYRVGQQQPQGPPASNSGAASSIGAGADGTEKAPGGARLGKNNAEEEDSNQDLGELDKMRRQLEEQLRAEDERAEAEADSFEEEAEAGGTRSGSREPSEEKHSVKKDAESNVQEDPTKEPGKTSEAVVEIPSHLPRKQRELLKRIQQQEISRQREKEKQEAAEKAEAESRAAQEAQAKAEVDDFYSSDEEGEGEDIKPKLTEVLKKLSEETSSSAPTSSASTAITTTAAAATTTSSAPSTFNIMQMIQAIKSKTGTSSLRDQANETQQAGTDSKKTALASPASPPASPTDKDQASLELGLRLQPLTVDPPVVSARPLRPLTYSVVKLSLSQARPYSQLPAGVTISDSRYRSDPRVKWHVQYMERQLKKKVSAGGTAESGAEVKRKASLDEDTIASPSPTQDTTQKPVDPRLKKADPRLQKAGASPNSTGTPGAAKAVDPRLERAANRPTDPRLAARAMDPRLNRQNSLPAAAQAGFNSQMGSMQMGGAMNAMAGGMNPMGPMQGNVAAMQGQMGGFSGNQMGAGLGQMGGMGMNSGGPRGGPMNISNIGNNNNMMMAGGLNRMGPAGISMGMGSANQPGGPMGVRPQMQGGIFVSGGGDMSTLGAAARDALSSQMMNSAPPNMQASQQGLGDVTPANSDPRLGGGPRPPLPSAMPYDPRLKNRAVDPRDPRDIQDSGADPRDPRGGSGFSNPKDPRSRDPRNARQFMDTGDSYRDLGSTNLSERYGGGNNAGSRPGWSAEEERTFSQSGFNNPPAMPASLAQPPQSTLPPSLSLNPSLSSPPQPPASNIAEKPSGVSANFDHRNDSRFKRVKRSVGPRAESMNYSSPLGGEQDGAPQAGNNSPSDNPNYNSYNRPKPQVPRYVERQTDTPSPTLPDTLEDFDMPETAPQPDVPVKDIFKSIDPTASPFC